MAYTLIDYTRAFHFLSKKLKLSAGVRSTYTALLGEFNESHWQERISLSDRELQVLAGLKSVASVHEAKNILKNHKLIDFKSKRGVQGCSEIWLLSDFLPDINRTFTEHLPNINRTLAEHSSRLNSSPPSTLKEEERRSLPIAGARERELDEVMSYWEEELRGGRISFEHQSLLQARLDKYGAQWLKDAMKTASDLNNNPRGISVKLLLGVIRRKEGGGSRDNYTPPTYDTEPWLAKEYDD